MWVGAGVCLPHSHPESPSEQVHPHWEQPPEAAAAAAVGAAAVPPSLLSPVPPAGWTSAASSSEFPCSGGHQERGVGEVRVRSGVEWGRDRGGEK